MSKSVKKQKPSKKSKSSSKNKTPEKSIDISFEEKLENIRESLRENYAQQKKLMNDLRELLSLHKKDIKLVKSNVCTNTGKHSGFNKPESVPDALKKLLGIEEESMPRSKVTALLYKYFTENNMYNTKTKKEIIPNQKIKKIFGMQDGDTITFYNLQSWLKKIYQQSVVEEIEV